MQRRKMPSSASLLRRFQQAPQDSRLRGADIVLSISLDVDLGYYVSILEKLGDGETQVTVEARVGSKVWRKVSNGPTSTYREEEIETPLSVRVGTAPSYKVSLVARKPIEKFVLNDAVICVANSIVSRLDDWEVRLMIARDVHGSISALPTVKAALDRPQEEILEDGARGGIYSFRIRLTYVGEPAQLTRVDEAIGKLMKLANPSYLVQMRMQEEIHHAAMLIVKSAGMVSRFAHEFGLKQLTPQAYQPTRINYADIYPPVGYYVTDKADGLHSIAVMREGRAVVITPGGAPEYREYYVASSAKPQSEGAVAVDAKPPTDTTIIEGEVTPDGVFRAFDVPYLHDKSLVDLPFSERLQELEKTTAEFAAFLPEPGLFVPKAFVHLTDSDPEELRKAFEGVLSAERPYDTDGIIMYNGTAQYNSRIHRIIKWKPAKEHSTIDFLVRRPPDSVLGRAPFIDKPGHKLYFLMTGVSGAMFKRLGLNYCPGYRDMFPSRQRRDYFPIQFQPSMEPYAYLYQHPDGAGDIEGDICEMLPVDGAWKLVRVREDRRQDLKKGLMFGNDFRTAEMIYNNYINPLTLEMLSHGPGDSYFMEEKAGIYSAPTAFIAYSKEMLVSGLLQKLSYLVDLGSGKGQNLGRFIRAGVKKVLSVDNDPEALAELVSRKYNWIDRDKRARTLFQVLRANFNNSHESVAAAIKAVPNFPQKGASGVTCFLAAHYAFETQKTMANFAALCKEIIAPGGTLILTLMFGDRVLSLLKSEKATREGQSWDARAGERLKYSVRRMFPQARLTAAGQKIGVVLPFSKGAHYEEYLSNTEAIEKAFARCGFKLENKKGFWEEYAAGFESSRSADFRNLTADDKKWLSLFGYMIFTAA